MSRIADQGEYLKREGQSQHVAQTGRAEVAQTGTVDLSRMAFSKTGLSAK
jgi:hypothetical protein